MRQSRNKTTIRKIVFTCIVLFACVLAVVAIHALFFISVGNEKMAVVTPVLTLSSQTPQSPVPLKHLIFARDTASREHGLSGRAGLPSDTGMLFVFDTSAKYGFWMKDMLFSIDMIWLDENFKVITVAEDISPNSFPQVFYPAQPARYVLEVASGVAAQNHYEEGSRLDFLSETHLQK